jgi:3-dehydroquinate dehydratase-1
MPQIKIGSCELGKIPRVVLIIEEPIPVKRLERAVETGADIFELRVDCFKGDFKSCCDYIKKIRSAIQLPAILTIRETKQNASKRLQMFKRLIDCADAVDIEIDAPILSKVVKLAKDKTIIISDHDFKKTPKNAKLGEFVDKAMAAGADIAKIAAMPKTKKDIARLLHFTESRSENMISISMGSLGVISRVIAPLFNSLLTYGYVTKAVAPGQISLEMLIEELRLFYPAFDAKFDAFA